jgi:hypothetical protein
MNKTPLAVPGRWRTVTMPHPLASWPFEKPARTSDGMKSV